MYRPHTPLRRTVFLLFAAAVFLGAGRSLGIAATGTVLVASSLVIIRPLRSMQMNLMQMESKTRLYNGIDILQKIKSNAHIRRSPVIVLTTTDDKAEIQRCYDLGCNVYVTKPVNYENFSQAIRQLGLFLSVMQVPEAN